MPRRASAAIVGAGFVALFSVAGCTGETSDSPNEIESSSATTGATQPPPSAPSAPAARESAPAAPTEQPTETVPEPVEPDPDAFDGPPTSGAIVRVGSQETVISTVFCHRIDGVWAMSAGSGNDIKVAVRSTVGNEDAIDSLSVIFPQGSIVQIHPGVGVATIERDGDAFTVTGMAERINLNDADATPLATPVAIAATCQY